MSAPDGTWRMLALFAGGVAAPVTGLLTLVLVVVIGLGEVSALRT